MAKDKKVTGSFFDRIQDKADMGLVKLSDSNAMSVCLIRTPSRCYIAIHRMYKTKKNDEWKPKKGGIWLPFENIEEIGCLINEAIDECLKRGWNESGLTSGNENDREGEMPYLELVLEDDRVQKKQESLFTLADFSGVMFK